MELDSELLEATQSNLITNGGFDKAKAAYNDFLTLWKDADPDIPILKEAKAEYAKLQSRLRTD